VYERLCLRQKLYATESTRMSEREGIRDTELEGRSAKESEIDVGTE